MTGDYQRPLGGNERMRLWFPNVNVVMGARIKGGIQAEDLRRAIQQARQKHPLLGARVQVGADGTAVFNTSDVPANELIVTPRKTTDDWIATAKTELKQLWPISSGPLARFTLLQSPDESDLVVNAHHSICDARSLTYLIRDILGFIAEPDQDIQPVLPSPVTELLPPSAAGGFLARWVMKFMSRRWLAKGISFGEDDYRRIHQALWRAHEPAVHAWALSGEQTTRLVERCKTENVSVNSMIYTAFLTAQAQVRDTGPDYFKNVIVPVDFTHYLTRPVGEALGFYASAIKFPFTVAGTKSFWENARDFDKQVQQTLTEKNIFASQQVNALHPSLMDGIVHAMFSDFDEKTASNLANRMRREARTGVLVSNLGRLDTPTQYGNLELAWIAPPAVYAGNADIAVEALTFAGELRLTLTYGAQNLPGKTIAQLVAAVNSIMTLTGAEEAAPRYA